MTHSYWKKKMKLRNFFYLNLEIKLSFPPYLKTQLMPNITCSNSKQLLQSRRTLALMHCASVVSPVSSNSSGLNAPFCSRHEAAS